MLFFFFLSKIKYFHIILRDFSELHKKMMKLKDPPPHPHPIPDSALRLLAEKASAREQ